MPVPVPRQHPVGPNIGIDVLGTIAVLYAQWLAGWCYGHDT